MIKWPRASKYPNWMFLVGTFSLVKEINLFSLLEKKKALLFEVYLAEIHKLLPLPL